MNSAVSLARGPRHDRHPGIQQVFAGELQIGMATAEHFREELLQATVNAVEVLFEACAGFAVDFADRVFQCIERVF